MPDNAAGAAEKPGVREPLPRLSAPSSPLDAIGRGHTSPLLGPPQFTVTVRRPYHEVNAAALGLTPPPQQQGQSAKPSCLEEAMSLTPRSQLTAIISVLLSRAATSGDNSLPAPEARTEFFLPRMPAFGVCEYTGDVADLSGATPEALLMAASLVARAAVLEERHVTISKWTVRRLWLAAVAVATRFLDNDPPPLDHLADVGDENGVGEVQIISSALIEVLGGRVVLGCTHRVVMAIATLFERRGAEASLEELASSVEEAIALGDTPRPQDMPADANTKCVPKCDSDLRDEKE